MRDFSLLFDKLSTSSGIADLGIAAMEALATLLLNGISEKPSAVCSVKSKYRTIPRTRRSGQTYRSVIEGALQNLVRILH